MGSLNTRLAALNDREKELAGSSRRQPAGGDLGQLREASENALAQADAIAQSLEELEGEDKPMQVQGAGEPEISEQSEATN